MANKTTGIDRLVRQIELEYNISDIKPDESRHHRDYLAWLSVAMLREISSVLNTPCADRVGIKPDQQMSEIMERLKRAGIL
jgi:mRNA-degrading endonuclease toxin of MazEF toxin-antitoxin module